MTQHIYVEPSTVTDIAAVLVPHNSHSTLARCAAEFFVEEHTRPIPGTKEIAEPRIDTRTIRKFVDFLIAKKGYN